MGKWGSYDIDGKAVDCHCFSSTFNTDRDEDMAYFEEFIYGLLPCWLSAAFYNDPARRSGLCRVYLVSLDKRGVGSHITDVSLPMTNPVVLRPASPDRDLVEASRHKMASGSSYEEEEQKAIEQSMIEW
jgi:hypothetical protein